MSDFEILLCCLLIPLFYITAYIAGKYDILKVICNMLQEWSEEHASKDGGNDGTA